MVLCGLAQLEVFLNDLNIVSYRTLGKTNTMIFSLIFQLCVELGVILITVLARTGQTNASKYFVHRSFQQLKKEMWFYHKIIVQHSENSQSFLFNGKIVQLSRRNDATSVPCRCRTLYRAMNRTLSVNFLACEKNIHDSYMELNNVSIPMFNKFSLFHSCADGWQGANCSECKPHPACHRGTCTQPWECNCYAGWGGKYCDLGKYFRSLDRINQGPQNRRRSLQLTNNAIVSITQKHFYSVAIIPFES